MPDRPRRQEGPGNRGGHPRSNPGQTASNSGDNPNPSPPPQGNEQSNEDYRWIKGPGMFALGLFTLVAVCVYAEFAREQVNETRESNNIARETTFQTNRPYVMWTGLSVIRVLNKDGTFSWRIGSKITNFGNTPAIGRTIKSCDPTIRHDTQSPVFNCVVSDPPNTNASWGPKQEITVNGPVVSSADMLATKVGLTYVYIYGEIIYEDTLRPGISHLTRFCEQVAELGIGVPPANQNSIPDGPDNPPGFTSATCSYACVDDSCSISQPAATMPPLGILTPR